MELKVYQVAAFTPEAFGGNPAAVVLLDEWIDDDVMQKIAAENNLSETAFLVPTGTSEWAIRWFTPEVEVSLCGHATLASAAVIRSQLGHEDWPITLSSASGPLKVDVSGDRFILDFPASPPVPVDPPDGLEAALGAPVKECLRGGEMLMVVLDDESAVAALRPDFGKLAEIVEQGLIATAPGDTVDFVSRFFAPAIGIDEDPVTGSAHCVLTPYWAARLSKSELEARQISSRVGYLSCVDAGDRTLIAGSAVFFLSGTLII
jgi:PhzF family phenazine biosynthesis protein